MRSRDAQKEMAAANPIDRERAASLPLSGAEDELLAALLAEPVPTPSSATQPSPRARDWRPRRLALGGAVALTAVGAALLVSAGGDNTPAAFAVEPQPGGGVKIEIYSLGDPEGVEGALEEAGIQSQVTYLPAGTTCREPHYQPSMALLRTLQPGQPQPQPWAGFDYESSDGPLTIAVGDYRQRLQMDEEIRQAVRQGDRSGAGWPSFVIDPTGLRPDQTLIMSSSPAPNGYTVGQVRVAEGAVDRCEPAPAADGPAPVRAPEGGWDFSETPYAGWGFGFGAGGVK